VKIRATSGNAKELDKKVAEFVTALEKVIGLH
jgi:hypothetical protein